MHSGKTQLPAGAGSRTLSDFQPPSIDTILSEGLRQKGFRELRLNASSSESDRHCYCLDPKSSISSISAIPERLPTCVSRPGWI